jgi:hypothetical protein
VPHPEREHSLQIEVARLRKRVEDGDAAARILARDVRAWSDKCDELREALAAARRECEGLRVHLRKMVDLADYHVNEIECIAENDFTPENITRAQMARVSLNEAEALAAPAAAAGEEGT